MKSILSELVLDLSFECSLAGGKKSEHRELQNLRLESFAITASRSTPGVINVPAGVCVLGVNWQGCIVVRSANVAKVLIVPPRSMFFCRGTLRLSALAAKGEHSVELLSWSSQTIPTMDQWLQNHASARNTKAHAQYLGCKPIAPDFVHVMERFEEAKSGASEVLEPLLTSVIFESVSRIMVGGDQMQLSPLPLELPEPIRKLTDAVRLDPTGNWSLKEASDMASYSPFHFSRVFKQLVGYGFHEYVDRCRTETAVNMLVTSDDAVDSIATNAGFGTTQGLRESVRDYLGLVPSEFRSLPEVYD